MATAKKSTTTKKTATPKGIVLNFDFDRDTKNTRRFAEVTEGDAAPVVGTLYVQKSAFKGDLPESVTVTIA